MKKLILLVTVVAISHNVVFSQIWAPVGTKWYYSFYSWWPPFINSPLIIESVGDTSISGKSCKVLFGLGVCGYAEEINYTYYEEGKVYIYNKTSGSFNILYDFSAGIGDTWTIVPPNPLDSFIVIVDSLYTRIINEESYLVQLISTVDPYSTYALVGEVVRGIGNVYFLYPLYSTCDPWPGPIRCFDNTESIIMFDTIPCDTTYHYFDLVNYHPANKSIKIFPNPASSFITITIPGDLPVEEAIIYNHLGQKVLTAKPVNNTVDVSGLKAGMYMIEVSAKDFTGRQKLIKQKF